MEKPGYFAVTPANVRHDGKICANAKLLYGEISALSKKEGFCWAGNAYFARLYGVSTRCVQYWIASLEKAGYISVKFRYRENSNVIEVRHIMPLQETNDDPVRNTPPDHAADPAQKSSRRGEEIFTGGGEKIFMGGGEKIFTYNNTSSNNINLKAAAAVPEPEDSPQKKTAAAETSELSGKIRAECARLSPTLILDDAFYPRAASFLSANSLDLRYPAWIFGLCIKKKPASLAGYFFRIFFEPRYASLHRAELENAARNDPPPPDRSCPVCGASFPPSVPHCPDCGFSFTLRGNPNALAQAKHVHRLPAETRAAYEADLKSAWEGNRGDFAKAFAAQKNVMARYGIPDGIPDS